jgi:hypothetical protein
MSVYSGPNVSSNGLVLYLDAGNQKSNGNNLVNTHNLTASPWSVENNIISATNEVISPIGTPVFKMTATGGGRTYLQQGYQSFSKTSSWTSSVYVRGGTYNFVRLGPSIASSADGVVVNLTTGAVVRTPYSVGYPTFTVSPEGNGWFRISRTVQNDSYVLKCFALYMTSYTGNLDAGDSQAGQFPANGEFIYVTAPQFEHTTSPRSYVQNNTTTRNWKDITGLNNEAVRVNGADFASATNSDIAMSFDGTDDYIDLTLSPSFQFGTNDFSIEYWIYSISKVSAAPPLFTNYNGWGSGAIFLGVDHVSYPNKYSFWINGQGTGSSTNTNITYNKWEHLVAVRDGGVCKLYLNGIQDGTTINGAGITLNGRNSSLVRIGAIQGESNMYNGKIANTKIYNRALTATEVQNNFNALRGRFNI